VNPFHFDPDPVQMITDPDRKILWISFVYQNALNTQILEHLEEIS